MTLITKTLRSAILKQGQHDQGRRELQKLAAGILSSAKRTIFALQREDAKGAAELLSSVRPLLIQGERLCKRDASLMHEGMWRAALEEYCEALFVHEYIVDGTLGKTALPTQDAEILIGGLSDFVGELARFGVLRATEGDRKTIDRYYAIAKDVVDILLQLDLTGSLRSKFDQAKQHLRKIEDLRYDLSRRI